MPTAFGLTALPSSFMSGKILLDQGKVINLSVLCQAGQISWCRLSHWTVAVIVSPVSLLLVRFA